MTGSRESSVDGPTPARIFGITVDRLTVRLAVGITLFVVVPLAAGLYVLSQRQYDRGIEARRSAAESENRILEAALRHRMMERDTTLLETILSEIAAHPEVRSIMIVDHDGEVRISSESSRVGSQLPKESPTCLVCHEKDPLKRDRWILLDEEEGGILRAVQPIENRPECHTCHEPDEQYNGMLLLDISLDQLEAQLSRDRTRIVVGAGLLALLLLGGVGLLVRSLILQRLARVGSAARSIAAGNFSERVPTGGNDVISILANDFNNMAGSVSELIAEVHQQEAQLSSVMNSLDDGLVVLDREGRIVACNQSFSRRVGKTPDVLQTQLCHDAVEGVLPCCQDGDECPGSRCLTTGEMQRATFRTSSATDETERVEEVYSSPVLDSRREVVQVVEVWRDITERVKEEEHLAEIERLVSLGTLASGFSHEVNTPLASILMSAESVIGRIDEAAPAGSPADLLPSIRESAEIVRKQVLRCRKTTEQFLRFSRGVPPSIDPIDLGKHVTETVSLTRPTARENNVDLRFEAPDGNPSVRANAELVQHVVLNLLINAIQSCGEEGGTVEVSFAMDRKKTCVLIRDTGSGIRSEDCRHLFEPFRSRKPRGTGLGLFLSRTLMRRFGGDIRLVETEVGVGSCFEIVFHCVTEAP
ncbi:MAG: ATP-binding protein [Acidobacteriota bacterium]|nr:ATP-binding protein [Acidobacteriota bacterium]MDH3784533.1 ATP-binding protein [Acidobacteriota bacterium]